MIHFVFAFSDPPTILVNDPWIHAGEKSTISLSCTICATEPYTVSIHICSSIEYIQITVFAYKHFATTASEYNSVLSCLQPQGVEHKTGCCQDKKKTSGISFFFFVKTFLTKCTTEIQKKTICMTITTIEHSLPLSTIQQ